jgi:hypothetical protein
MPLSTVFQYYRGSQLVDEIRVPGENHRPVASHEALHAGRPVVALESTIITHGMPYPHNLR